MPVRLGRFEMPKRLTKEESRPRIPTPSLSPNRLKPVTVTPLATPLRRVLLSSLEGAAITSIKIDGAMHEFAAIEGVNEDVTDIVLNLKKVSSRRTPATSRC